MHAHGLPNTRLMYEVSTTGRLRKSPAFKILSIYRQNRSHLGFTCGL